jgi:hypothetical protein
LAASKDSWRGFRFLIRNPQSEIRNLNFAFASFCAIVLIANSALAADLQWRRGRTPALDATAKADSTYRRDSAVRQAGFDESASPFGSGQATLRSVVVQRDEQRGATLRSAQVQPPIGGQDSTSSQSGQTQSERDFMRELERTIATPPGGQPGVTTPGTTTPGERPLDAAPLQLPGALPPQTLPPSPLTPPPATPTQPGDQFPGTPELTAPAEAIEAERRRSEEVCRQETANLQTATLERVVLDINLKGTPGRDFPFKCVLGDGTWHAGRCWPETVFMWKASALCHKPLYFEDEQMERYGHSWGPCCDPIVSGVHFFTRLPVLPYCMGVTPPCECVYTLGHYRPGSCAPYYIEPVPISLRGALFQAGATVGAAAILP